MNTSKPQSISSSTLSKTWPAWLLFLAGLLVTAYTSLQVKERIESEAVQQVSVAYDQATLKIQERLSTYAQILRGGAGLFAASETVNRAEWRDYVDKLHPEETVPGVQGIGFSLLIPPGQLDAHIEAVRREGFPTYTVRPPGDRATVTSIIYLEPFSDRNLRAFGFDMFSESVRRTAMEQARDTGSVSLSGKVELVQETAKDLQAGTLMYVPVYRNGAVTASVEERRAAIVGWAYSPFRMNDLMNGILRHWEASEGLGLDLQIYDGQQIAPSALLFDSQPNITPSADSLFYQQRRLEFNGRQWLLVFDHTISNASLNYSNAWFTMFGGIVISGLLFGLVLSTIHTRTKAERIAGELVAKIVDREASLAQHAEALAQSNAELIRLGVVMAHHFQEPSRRLVSFSKRLQMKSALVNDEDSRQSLKFIEQQAQRLSVLVRDAQHYLSLENEKVGAGETADTAAVLRQSIASAGNTGAEIIIREPLPPVRLEATRLIEVFTILLDNALLYRHPERSLRIEVSAIENGNRAVFRFADNGSGIAPEYRIQIFELFSRLVPNNVPGTGMGLALASKIIQQADGKLSVEDGIEGGACFMFDLPLGSKV